MKVKMDTKAVLLEARELISLGWNQGYIASDFYGNEVGPLSPKAVSFCLIGALICAVKNVHPDEVITSRMQMEKEIREFIMNYIGEGTRLNRFNDDGSRTQDEVLEMLDGAILSVE